MDLTPGDFRRGRASAEPLWEVHFSRIFLRPALLRRSNAGHPKNRRPPEALASLHDLLLAGVARASGTLIGRHPRPGPAEGQRGHSQAITARPHPSSLTSSDTRATGKATGPRARRHPNGRGIDRGRTRESDPPVDIPLGNVVEWVASGQRAQRPTIRLMRDAAFFVPAAPHGSHARLSLEAFPEGSHSLATTRHPHRCPSARTSVRS